jgi:HTH-type transcriptional regulator / antitoxin HigA
MTRINGKMIPTFDSKVYGELLIQHYPRIIKTEAENECFLAVVEALMNRANLSAEEEVFLELLVKLIEDFEEKHYSLNVSTPRSRLLHLMEEQGLQSSDLVPILGTSLAAVEVLEGQGDLNLEQAQALGQFFHVQPQLFLSK